MCWIGSGTDNVWSDQRATGSVRLNMGEAQSVRLDQGLIMFGQTREQLGELDKTWERPTVFDQTRDLLC